MKYMMTPGGRGLGWLPDVPDPRDHMFSPQAILAAAVRIPSTVDLRAHFPAVYNQGQLGSCTANALAAAYDYDRHKQGKPFMSPSRLFIYWNERSLEGTIASDAGARIRDGVKVLAADGVPPEADWPYDIAEFTVKPPAKAFANALRNQALSYQRIMRPGGSPLGDMLSCLAAGLPFVTGITVYQSFETAATARTGIIPMPGSGETVLGGHAVVVAGYDQAKQHFICRNSWGAGWGDKGYFYLPFAYLASTGLSSDQWVIRTVEV